MHISTFNVCKPNNKLLLTIFSLIYFLLIIYFLYPYIYFFYPKTCKSLKKLLKINVNRLCGQYKKKKKKKERKKMVSGQY